MYPNWGQYKRADLMDNLLTSKIMMSSYLMKHLIMVHQTNY